MTAFQVSVMEDDNSPSKMAVLRVASAAKNSQSQFFPVAVRVSGAALGELHRKMMGKLKLHSIDAVTLALTLKLENDKTLVFTDAAQLSFDTEVDSLTSLVSMRWQFVFK